MPQVNPEILKWAREAAGLSLAEAAKKIQLNATSGLTGAERLKALEAGEGEPTRALISRMAKKYRRPLVTFYLSGPPQRGDRGEDFRTLPESQEEKDEALLDALLRQLKAAQSLVRAALVDEGDARPLPFIGSMTRRDGADAVLGSLRGVIGLPLEEFRAARGARAAFDRLREHVERSGIFVLLAGDLGSWQTILEVETFRGIALTDDLAPFVVLNPNDSSGALSFSLIHELVHLWVGESGVSGGPPTSALERFCNDVASEFLLPRAELDELQVERDEDIEDFAVRLTGFAERRNVSSSMVAYKLFRLDAITRGQWEELNDRFRELWLAGREVRRRHARESERPSGPSYWVLRQYRVGHGLLRLTARLVGAGELSTSKASVILGVRPQQVEPLMEAGGVHVGGW